MADTYTTNLNLTKPEPGAAEDTWGISLNADLDALDAIFSSSGTQINLNPNQVNFADNKKAIFGTGSDLSIFHDGSNSYIQDSGTGNLKILADNLLLQRGDASQTYIQALTGGAVDLRYAGSAKLATTSSGIDVTGTVTSDGLTVDGADVFFNSGWIKSNSSLRIDIDNDNNQTDRAFFISHGNASKDIFKASENGDISFYDDTGSTQGLFWDASAEKLGVGTTNPTYKLHVAGAAYLSGGIQLNSSDRVKFGNGNQYITGVNSTSLTLVTGNSASLTVLDNGSVGIGTTNPTSTLTVDGTINNVAIKADETDFTDSILISTTGTTGTLSGTQNNTGLGNNVFINLTTANNSTAIGESALANVTTGSNNTAIGSASLSDVTTASGNTAVGVSSLANNTASENTAIGKDAARVNTTGNKLVAVGFEALELNTTGNGNTAIGYEALLSNTTGSSNVAVGRQAVQSNTTATNNIGLGFQALKNNTIGNGNVGVGYQALLNTTGYDNTGLGKLAGELITTGDNNTCIGNDSNPASATTDNSITLGDANITSLRCNTQTISALSDARDKANVEDLQLGVEFIKDLRPVSFTWERRDNTHNGVEDFGFIAQELDAAQEKHNEAERLGLVLKDNPERLEASYGKLVPMLVKAIQELSEEVESLKQKLGE